MTTEGQARAPGYPPDVRLPMNRPYGVWVVSSYLFTDGRVQLLLLDRVGGMNEPVLMLVELRWLRVQGDDDFGPFAPLVHF